MKNQIEIYKSEDGQTEVEVRFEEETVWLSQYQLAELFNTDRTSLLKHLKNIYETRELDEKATCAKIAQVRQEGKRKVTISRRGKERKVTNPYAVRTTLSERLASSKKGKS